MPLFEFACRGCGHHFEYLTRDGQSPTCPACSGADLEKLLSAFALGANGSGRRLDAPPVGACGSCGDPRGPGSCSRN